MRVLVDMDGVVADFAAAIDGAAARLGARPPAGPATAQFELEQRYPDVGDRLRDLIREPGFYADLPLVDSAAEGVTRLRDAGLDVWFCTAPVRSRWCAGEKIDWVARHFGRDMAGRTVVTKDKTLVRGDVLIDDKPSVDGADTPTWSHLLFDQPYNRTVPRPRLRSWSCPQLVADVTAAAAY